jgi:hypothetical protein
MDFGINAACRDMERYAKIGFTCVAGGLVTCLALKALGAPTAVATAAGVVPVAAGVGALAVAATTGVCLGLFVLAIVKGFSRR